MKSIQGHELVMGIHPTSRGFGWMLFEGPGSPIDWGIACARRKRSARSMAKFKRLLKRYGPRIVVFEEFNGRTTRREPRIRRLYRVMIAFAKTNGIKTEIYTRETVGLYVARKRAAKRGENAAAVAEKFRILRKRLPPVRKSWMPEDERQCLFDATALVLTHFGLAKSGP